VPHAHAVLFSPDQNLVFIAELGLDRVYAYRFNAATHSLVPHHPPCASANPGSGPRHLAVHPNGKFLFVNNETDSTVTSLMRQADGGVLVAVQTVSTVPSGFHGTNSTAEIQVDSAGKFLYVSNRGHDSIAVFSLDAERGTLSPIEYVSTQGKTPRNFSLDPTGSYLFAANENSATS
jgi:6-phosphogluconolactonase